MPLLLPETLALQRCWRCWCFVSLSCFLVSYGCLFSLSHSLAGSAPYQHRVLARTYAKGGHPLPNFRWRRFIFRADKHFTSSSTSFFLAATTAAATAAAVINIPSDKNFELRKFLHLKFLTNNLTGWVKRGKRRKKSSKLKRENRKIKTIYTRNLNGVKLLLAKQQRFALMYLYARQMNGSIIKEVRDRKKPTEKETPNLPATFSFRFGFAQIQTGDVFAYTNKIECITK